MRNIRIIARLDIKQEHLIKGIHLEGWRKVGDPAAFSERYYAAGVDELLYMDVVASLYGRNNLTDIVERTARNIFVPLCVGGGVRSIDDADNLLRSGADKVAVNTGAVARPELLGELAARFGSQAVVLSIEAKARDGGGWEAYTDNGREHTGLDVVEWAGRAESLGVGEVLVTSVDRDGTGRGPDIELIRAVSDVTDLPVIAGGGIKTPDHALAAVRDGGADAVSLAKALHYDEAGVADIRAALLDAGYVLPTHRLPDGSGTEARA